MNLRAGVVVTGTEVLTGRISDRNGPWVSERLGELGVEVSHICCVGDRRADLEAILRFLEADGIDLIVTTGGLGPTADDITAEVVAAFAGAELVLDTGMEAKITAIIEEFAKRFKFDPEGVRAGTRKQAMVPRGATPIDPEGTAPGLVVEARDVVVIVLPGPPRELQGMWRAATTAGAAAALLERSEPYEELAIRMFGLPESTLAQTLRAIEGETDISVLEVTTCLRGGSELEIDVRFRARHREVAQALHDGLVAAHGEHIYSERGESIDEVVARLLSGRSIALAESCTAGMLAARLTRTPGSSEYVRGGVVAYSNEAKTELLGVAPGLIETHGAVSPEVAEAMADGAIERFGAEIGVGITGIAGPGGGSEEKPVGYVCMCVKAAGGEMLARDPQLPGGRDDVRERTVAATLHLIRRLVSGGDAPF